MGLIVSILAIISINLLNGTPKNDGPTIGPTQNDGPKNERKTEWPSVNAKYITAVPLDLTQIKSFSKFRSCAGHDYPGYNFDQILETDRSMKHYIYPTAEFQGTLDKVKMLAPFDGTVSKFDLEKDKVGGRLKGGNAITFSTPVDEVVRFEFGHLYFVKDFKVGDEVKAGELVGYAALAEKENDFDIDLFSWIYINGGETRAFDSAFSHMTDPVLAEFAKYGITPENTKISKEARDASPCNYTGPDKNQSSQGTGRTGDDWIQLIRLGTLPK